MFSAALKSDQGTPFDSLGNKKRIDVPQSAPADNQRNPTVPQEARSTPVESPAYADFRMLVGQMFPGGAPAFRSAKSRDARISQRMDPDTVELLDDMAEKHNQWPADVLRTAIWNLKKLLDYNEEHRPDYRERRG